MSQSGVRRAPFERTPIFRAVFAPGERWRMPWWLRRLLLALLVLLLVLLALVSCRESEKPASLATSTLLGPRLTAGPICIEEAIDVSGSMTDFVAQRELAERELFAFARRELGPDDLLSEAYFAGSAEAVLPPSAIATLSAPPAPPFTPLDAGTLLAPAIDALVQARPPGGDRCAARGLVVITDGIVGDDPATLEAALRAAGYTRMYAVLPVAAGRGRPTELTGGLLDSIVIYRFHGGGLPGLAASVLDDAKPLDVVFGDIVGALTGQRLGRLPEPAAPAAIDRYREPRSRHG